MPKEKTYEVRIELKADRDLVSAIDAWRRKQPDLPSRSEAIRRLAREALGKAAP